MAMLRNVRVAVSWRVTYTTEVTRRTLMPTIYLDCSTQYGKVMTVLCSEITERALPTVSVF